MDEWWFYFPAAFCTAWVFALGLGIGSFLNVLVFRLPFEKSPAWPNSRCMACLRPLRLTDNLPIWGYLRLRGRCRFCKTRFSPRYLVVEVGTGLAFVALFVVEILLNVHRVPGLPAPSVSGPDAIPPLRAWVYFAAHAYLISMLIAASAIDLDYRIIPTQITYFGTILGLIVSAVLPWPWPSPPSASPLIRGADSWSMFVYADRIPIGLAMWPAWQPPAWAPAGSVQLGLLTGVAGAAAGMFVIRALKWVFEFGFGQEAVGLGDADLLMMAGAFLGWQIVVLAVPVGAVLTLLALPGLFAWAKLRRRAFDPAIPFGPGLAAGVVACWLGWPVVGELARTTFFEPVILGFVGFMMFGGLLAAGLMLKRRSK